MIENDTWYRCNVCGREGRVGRCCSDEDRTPLNDLAKKEQARIKGAKVQELTEFIVEEANLTTEQFMRLYKNCLMVMSNNCLTDAG